MADIKLVPGEKPVRTADPDVVVGPMPQAGVYVFTVKVVDDIGGSAEASLQVTVRRG